MFFLKALPSQRMAEGFTGSSKEAESVVAALQKMRLASLLIREVERYFREHGLSQLQFLVLIAIKREPDRDSLRATELAERLDVSKPVLHRTIRALIADGYIDAREDLNDRRAEQLALTSAGDEKLAALLPGYFNILISFDWNGSS